MMLQDEIAKSQKLVRTDAYQMSIGEVVNMYTEGDLVIDPEFQRLFRWEIGQKSKLIESILLGIPLPSIFVYERPDGKWELIDGLQRCATLLEFMGLLKGPDGQPRPPSALESTKYLASLRNVVWDISPNVVDVPIESQIALHKSEQLAIRRARIGVEILKRPSDEAAKFELFQRLNAGGTQANAQELRNCIVLMVNSAYFRDLKIVAETAVFQKLCSISEDQAERQRHMELACRFLVHAKLPYDGKLDVEEHVDLGIIELARIGNSAADCQLINRTFEILRSACGDDALRRFHNGSFMGKVGLVGLEGVAVGVAKNIDAIEALGTGATQFLRGKVESFWSQPEAANLTSPGLRGTIRIQRTVPFGARWFAP